jgi:hypothetical protein
MDTFVKMWHPEIEGEAIVSEKSVSLHEKKGWNLVRPEPSPESDLPLDESKPKSKKVKKTESAEE